MRKVFAVTTSAALLVAAGAIGGAMYLGDDETTSVVPAEETTRKFVRPLNPAPDIGPKPQPLTNTLEERQNYVRDHPDEMRQQAEASLDE